MTGQVTGPVSIGVTVEISSNATFYIMVLA